MGKVNVLIDGGVWLHALRLGGAENHRTTPPTGGSQSGLRCWCLHCEEPTFDGFGLGILVRTRGGIVGLDFCFQDTQGLSLGGKIMHGKHPPDSPAETADTAVPHSPPIPPTPSFPSFPPPPPSPSVPLIPPIAPVEAKQSQEPIQTAEELAFYAPSHMCLTILAIITFPPLGIPAAFFSYQVK